jgi:hypothetical protein
MLMLSLEWAQPKCHFERRPTQEGRGKKVATIVVLADVGWEWGVESKPTAVKNVVFFNYSFIIFLCFLLPWFPPLRTGNR